MQREYILECPSCGALVPIEAVARAAAGQGYLPRDVEYRARCPKCDRRFQPVEIELLGFQASQRRSSSEMR